jgi:hemolysin III
VSLRPAETTPGLRVKPRLRGLSHEIAFFLVLPLGAALIFEVNTPRGRVSAIVFAASVAAIRASGLYHRVNWSPRGRRWMRRLDHAGIYALIAGTYTPFGLLVLRGDWSVVVLAIVWSGTAAAVALKFLWFEAPKWLSALIGVVLGWVGVVVFPQLIARIGLGPSLLVVAGGLAYTAGAVIYALRRPDPFPVVFGYHELFHACVIVAVACQYAAIALLRAAQPLVATIQERAEAPRRQPMECRREGLREETRNLRDVSDESRTVPARVLRAL